ncbi:NBR1-Ig-like domain-containing protein [Amycolatopsis roodepoortensis]|uniref:NBR1-Ig-like domain-containing protein n=1 Tax=Amycolatopsis roodepoortensis TaxID=700274 RepID=UPI00214BEAEF|nr:NBR1-Ig-like domain-containing protein [Amycolatopsis roodepoortensis]UUV29289.1 NBR1-Ig-like domain-containing protein [Amycolatopsis roodepoortensis]
MDVERTPGRRGRVARGPAEDSGPVAEFARRLWELKRAAGDPSYDRMRDEYGALASKSALSAAARGERLPSWETTWEFVRVLAAGVLGGDEDEVRHEWRGEWERARDAVTAGPGPVAVKPRRTAFLLAGAVAIVLVAALVFVFAAPFGAEPAAPAGDASEFVADVTVPDGSEVAAGSTFVKTWEFRNAGTVGWIGRYLVRAGSFGNPGECGTPDRVPVPQTAPGERVRVSVEVRAPDAPGHCQVYWKMADEQGRILLPNTRAVFFSVRVI